MTPARAGVLVAAKPAAMTSFDVVAAVRRVLRVRRVGHAGTLDPDATGVLPILIGEATKLMPYLTEQDKEYRVTVRFGVTTDTLDVGGRVLAQRPVGKLERSTLEATVARFVGTLAQVPPMFSAVHHEGRRLYELAREGMKVSREPRQVVIHAITVDEIGETIATLTVVCGKGTYIRVLASDLGEALGFGGAVERLVRTRVGLFTLAQAVAWQEITSIATDELWARVLPAEAAISDWTEVRLDDARARAFVHGQSVAISEAASTAGLRRVHDAAGRLLGVGEVKVAGDRVKPLRIFHVDRPGTRVLPV